MSIPEVVFGFGAHSVVGDAPDLDSLGRWGGEIVPAVREAVAKETARP